VKHPQPARPWYREPWPWILFGLPVSAVIAGIITLVIAVKNEDGLVAEDYYKQGLAINQVLERESRAAALGLVARVSFDGTVVRVDLSGDGGAPPTLTLRFAHPTRAGEDRSLPLARAPGGWYQGERPALSAGRWLVQLEDGAGTWRLSSSDWRMGAGLTLGDAAARGGDRPS
jgi:uncharacterized protein